MKLIDIETHADDAIFDDTTQQPVLYQDATELLVAHIDVVGPLDTDRLHILRDNLGDAVSHSHRHQKLPVDGDIRRMNQHREEQVLATLRLPRVRATASSRRLIIGPDSH